MIQFNQVSKIFQGKPAADFDLAAHIRVVDGDRVLADNAEGDEKMCRDFAAAINARLN